MIDYYEEKEAARCVVSSFAADGEKSLVLVGAKPSCCGITRPLSLPVLT